jgi:hypothetical protein
MGGKMTSKKVTQYKCDFCGKKGLSAMHMKRHEKRCTKNPDRVCGMCELFGTAQADMAELLAILPEFPRVDGDKEQPYIDAVEAVMQKIRDLTDNCPACILSALRQKGIPLPVVKSFDYMAERKSMFDEYNADQYEANCRCYDY